MYDSAFRFWLVFDGALYTSQTFDGTAQSTLTNCPYVRLKLSPAAHSPKYYQKPTTSEGLD